MAAFYLETLVYSVYVYRGRERFVGVSGFFLVCGDLFWTWHVFFNVTGLLVCFFLYGGAEMGDC